MLFSAELIRTVAEHLKKYAVRAIVLDPVMVAQSGDRLLRDEALEALKQHLIPLAQLITPNLPETSMLLGREIASADAIAQAAIELAHLGCANVLIKGGHFAGSNSDDYLYLGAERRLVILRGERIATRNNHGTGCTLSSAIASFIARGESIEQAVRLAKEYITGALRAGAAYTTGHGHGPVHMPVGAFA
jgi:hydroxymethylpyrimidine/phosphomethylpyrimidine kinase